VEVCAVFIHAHPPFPSFPCPALEFWTSELGTQAKAFVKIKSFCGVESSLNSVKPGHGCSSRVLRGKKNC